VPHFLNASATFLNLTNYIIMTTTLYFAPGACSFVPHVMLELAGKPYETTMVKLHKGEQQSEQYLAINPRGQVPVLVLSEEGKPSTVISQIVAIVNFLHETNPSAGILPSEPLKKANALQTFAWMNNTVHTTFTHVFMPAKFSDDAACQAQISQYNQGVYLKLIQELNALVQNKTTAYLTGDTLGALDAYSLTLTRWAGIAKIDPTQFQALWAHVQLVASHLAVAKVIERERLSLNMYQAG
jgi:glutathione S-transferase